MTISYTAAIVYDTAGSAATNTTSFVAALKSGITANAAWSTQEDVSSVGSSNYRWIVLKCASGSSGLSTDFYVLFAWIPGTSTTFNMYCGETYTGSGTSGRTLGKLCSTGTVSSFTPASDATCAATLTQGATGIPTYTGTGPGVVPSALTLAVTATNPYWLCVYPEHFVIASEAANPFYVGGFTSLTYNAGTADPMPLVLACLNPVSSTQVLGGVSRMPGMASTASTAYLWGVAAPVFNAQTFGNTPGWSTWATPYPAVSGSVGYAVYDALQNNTIPLSECLVIHWGSMLVTTNAKITGFLRGKFNNLRLMSVPPSGMAIGDTIVYNGTHWVCVGISSSINVAVFSDTGV